MSERQRVLLALQGKHFPREGDIGLFTELSRLGNTRARVTVVRVSPTGQTIWTRFTENARQKLHNWVDETNRWWRVADDDLFRFNDAPLYRAGSDSIHAPPGEISFPDVLPEDTV